MNSLIVYMSHHGTTRKVALQLAEHLGKDKTTLIDLNSEVVPDLNLFDTILIGGSIHAGQIQKKISEFCTSHQDILKRKRVGLFMCAMEKHEIKAEFDKAFPEWLRKLAVAHGFFGGELLLEKMNFIERTFVKTIYGIKKSVYDLNHEAIES